MPKCEVIKNKIPKVFVSFDEPDDEEELSADDKNVLSSIAETYVEVTDVKSSGKHADCYCYQNSVLLIVMFNLRTPKIFFDLKIEI